MRLHALQGRQSVECPKCHHGLHLHGDEGCRVCTSDLDEAVRCFASCFMREAVLQSPCASEAMQGRALARRAGEGR